MRKEDLSPAEDRLNEREKLDKYSGDVDWDYLKPHFESGVLIYVDAALDLKAVGVAFAEDDKQQVEAWLASGDLLQPSELHAEYWAKAKARFNAMIVRPFILAQPIAKQG